jgi:hypothetical protein
MDHRRSPEGVRSCLTATPSHHSLVRGLAWREDLQHGDRVRPCHHGELWGVQDWASERPTLPGA